MATLPQFQSDDKDFSLMQNKWAALINPVLTNPLMQGQLLPNVSILLGPNVINHKLGRKLVGWFLVGINGAAVIYDTQASNQTADITLKLTSDNACIVQLYVF